MKGKLFEGPTRASRGITGLDLQWVRRCGSREQMCNFIKLLHNGHTHEHLRGYEKILRMSSLRQCTASVMAAEGSIMFTIPNPFFERIIV